MKKLYFVAQSETRLDIFLTNVMVDECAISRSRVQQMIADGCVSVNGLKCLKNSNIVFNGDNVEVELHDNCNLIVDTNIDLDLDVVYEDDHIIVINKQSGLVVHPAHGNENGTLLQYLNRSLSIDDIENDVDDNCPISLPALVHRLDKDTTGVMVIAKTVVAYKSLIHQFASKTARRLYYTFVWGYVENSGVVNTYIGRGSDRKKMAVLKSGKVAITHYTVKKYFQISHKKYVSLVECSLETGRTHQIRVHMRHIGHPVVGDTTYFSAISKNYADAVMEKGINVSNVISRQALHSHSLKLTHPVSGRLMLFEAKIPSDMRKLYDLLEKCVDLP